MMFNVPQFIDVEDKIVGPLTWKQLLWMIGMGAALLSLFNIFEKIPFVIIAIPTTLAFVAFAFYRPNGFPLTTFVFYTILFIFRPKIAVWERPLPEHPKIKEPEKQEETLSTDAKRIDSKKLEELAGILDKR